MGQMPESGQPRLTKQMTGFRQMLVHGDTDFTQTKHLDLWDSDGVQFIFGVNKTANLHVLADDLPVTAWQTLSRPPRYEVKTKPRQRPANVKEPIVVERGFENIRLVSEDVAEFDYRPTACRTISEAVRPRRTRASRRQRRRWMQRSA
jgi:hypothetical protein